MKKIEGGICAPQGFRASGVRAGIRGNKPKRDLSLIVSDVPATAAATYTTNLVKGAPLTVTKEHLKNSHARAIICNSGNANTCNANGIEIAEQTCELLATELNIDASDICVASTGVIGEVMSIEPFKKAIPGLVAELSYDGCGNCVEGIMTTDTIKKEVAYEFELYGKTVRIGGIAKGSGMIHPNMATMLSFITTDACISDSMLRNALQSDIQDSYNMLSIDGDTSTNDMCIILANGLAGNKEIDFYGPEFDKFKAALHQVTTSLVRLLASDGEGASKLIVCHVQGGAFVKEAKKVAKSVICSNLLKCAVFGADANWGRVLCAIGYSGAKIDVNKVDVTFISDGGVLPVCRDGAGIPFSEELAKEVLSAKEINIEVDLKDGKEEATAWGCDLTYDYVKINGDYRT